MNKANIIILLQCVTLVTLGFKFQYSRQIERDVLKAQAIAEQAVKSIDKIQLQRAQTLQKLKENNPSINVPEPYNGGSQ